MTEQTRHVLLQNVSKGYADRSVLNGLNLRIEQGEFIAIVGKSGCGKSTLLRLIAGLEKINDGSILINNNELVHVNEQARMMFQDGRLLPWKKVIDNVCVGLSKDARDKATMALQQVGLHERMGDYPGKLSGGQQQRVALARALVHDPSLLLLDEPLGALDALTRIEMQDLIEKLWEENNFTSILVTHDVEEAVSMADRVVLIENGTISMDQIIHLPRPRQRSHPAFSMYVEEILERIMDRKQTKDYVI
ncbi:ATP-binding cassette domain-containing protein [Lentibacillus songyuanensis]|uniref:ATP-binding cassette domain-containing protein n=1 Tax=Lentibacillus songyuanensis TaxID=3136161 RepID=UPI003862169D